MIRPAFLLLGCLVAVLLPVEAAQDPNWEFDRQSDHDLLPTVPEGFAISFFAREPLVRQPGAMAFDAEGRLCVGMGPQYRNPTPDTPGDSVVFVLDTDGDGKADETRTFATGFNCIQGLAWRGDELWIANAPDLTVVRDLDGDDVADQYIRLYTDLGNLEHGLHGLTWGPDGRLYMSKGNSKGLTQPGRVAPGAFRDLWGVTAPANTPDFPEPVRFTAENYRKNHHDPRDDWGREGGVLRCDRDGGNLEIISRGARNPWDIAMDDAFNWLGTDNDQTQGDQIFMPYPGAHFGWNHPWSSHWGTEPHAPTAPVSGPLFDGSGTGIIFGSSPAFPESHRDVFFINDWLNKMTYVWRPRWDGALLRSENGLETFIVGGKSLFRPTDIEVGPDGALWILGWGSGYGAEFKDGKMTSEGRVFRVTHNNRIVRDENAAGRRTPIHDRPVEELLSDCESPLPVRRIDAQDEIVRRGASLVPQLVGRLDGSASQRQETWLIWTLARMDLNDQRLEERLAALFSDRTSRLNVRIQSLRALADRDRRSSRHHVAGLGRIALADSDARLRIEGVHAVRHSRPPGALDLLRAVLTKEDDPTVYYAGWQALRRLVPREELRRLLQDDRPAIRRAAVLALLEDQALELAQIRELANDASPLVRDLARLRLNKGAEGERAVLKGRPLNARDEPPPAAQPGRWTAAPPHPPIISEIRANNGGDYRVVADLRPGARPYTDRRHTIERVPEALLGATFIQTQNEDEAVNGSEWLSFVAHRPVRITMALDHRLPAAPRWMRGQFTPLTDVIQADHWFFRLHTAEFPAGKITLGGNTDDAKPHGKGMYIAIVEPLPLQPPIAPATVATAMQLVGNGDPHSGRWLFHDANGPGCFQCHRLDDHGNAFGPDLTALATRSTVQHAVQSMLEPDAVITEGFQQIQLETDDETLAGILIEESGLGVSLGLADGTRRTVPNSRIRSRGTSRNSAMPGYAMVLRDQEVADLTAYLMTEGSPITTNPGPTRSAAPETGFAFELRDDRLVMTRNRRPLLHYVFSDSEVRRPYFANVHSPGGARITRNHPPIEGTDAGDHATMHPGLWLAFGDLNGHDFWRHKAAVRHAHFVAEPKVENNTLNFAVENHWIGTDGSLVCRETAHFGFSGLNLNGGVRGTTLVWDASFVSDEHELRFGHQEEMGLGIRVASGLTVKTGKGTILNSRGQRNEGEVWGNTADWWSYGGNLGGEFTGILIVPDQKFTPVCWGHARDYGALVINPTRSPPARDTFIGAKRGVPLRLRYGVLFFSATDAVPLAPVARAFEDFLSK